MPGIFDLPKQESEPKLILLPVSWDATASYGKGTSEGPNAILQASDQLDLFDSNLGHAYRPGIELLKEDENIASWNQAARQEPHPEKVNSLSHSLNDLTYKISKNHLDQNQFVGVVGGEHSVPYGLIKALSEKNESFGILHFDAHHDLREAYQGYQHSHASIMYNALKDFSNISKLISVGIRDFCKEEFELANHSKNRIHTYYDRDLSELKFQSVSFEKTAKDIVRNLPENVYVSFDIDGLDPRYCPSTGTPVPGGLEFNEAVFILKTLSQSGRKIIGFDLCEVAPHPNSEWDANVGMRMLYQLCGWLFRSQKLI